MTVDVRSRPDRRGGAWWFSAILAVAATRGDGIVEGATGKGASMALEGWVGWGLAGGGRGRAKAGEGVTPFLTSTDTCGSGAKDCGGLFFGAVPDLRDCMIARCVCVVLCYRVNSEINNDGIKDEERTAPGACRFFEEELQPLKNCQRRQFSFAP